MSKVKIKINEWRDDEMSGAHVHIDLCCNIFAMRVHALIFSQGKFQIEVQGLWLSQR